MKQNLLSDLRRFNFTIFEIESYFKDAFFYQSYNFKEASKKKNGRLNW
jgi:hypothetical protein